MEYGIVRTALNTFKFELTDGYTFEFKVTRYTSPLYAETDYVPSNTAIASTINNTTYGYSVVDTTSDSEVEVLLEDGVYLIYTKVNSTIIRKHLMVVYKDVYDYLDTTIQNLLCNCTADPNQCGTVYDLDVLTNMVFSYLGWEFENISFNYGNITEGVLYINNTYKVITSPTFTANWNDSVGTRILTESNGKSISISEVLSVVKTYTAVTTATPITYGGASITPLNDAFITELQKVANIIDRAKEYMNESVSTT